jgi:putative redox protein
LNAKATWRGNLSFTSTADSGFAVPLGAKAEVGGGDDGFRPIELIAIGLAGCTAMDVISILKKKRQQVTDFEVQVNAERAEEHPKVFTSAVIEYFLSGNGLTESAVKRAIELSATRYCPAQAMLGEVFPIALKYTIYEDKGGGERELVLAEEYTLSLD